jgi:DNA helicase-2/ATP-dependent DNA helicase PcrA
LNVLFFDSFFLGDPDQSIYSWRFANPDLIKEMEKEFEHVIFFFLEQNYRSTKMIVAASDFVIHQGKCSINGNHENVP